MARHDLACVIHTHTADGMADSAQEEGLLPISQHALKFYNRLAYHSYEGIALGLEERERDAGQICGCKGTKGQQGTNQGVKLREEDSIEDESGRCRGDEQVVPLNGCPNDAGSGNLLDAIFSFGGRVEE